MKVNGRAFKKAREEIRKNANAKGSLLRGEASEGTQEWLAQVAKIRSSTGDLKSLSVRSIQYLEKGTASIATIDAVSSHLRVNGRELIIGYGTNLINLDAPIAVDFRPSSYPYSTSDFYLSPFLLTIDPLIIDFVENDDVDTAKLISMSIKVNLEPLDIDFYWLYKVGLNSGGTNWLGFQSEVFPEKLASSAIYKSAIMFSQRGDDKISWKELIRAVETTTKRIVQLNVTIEFEYFVKEIKIGVVVSEMKSLFSKGREKYNSNFPHFIQPKTVIW